MSNEIPMPLKQALAMLTGLDLIVFQIRSARSSQEVQGHIEKLRELLDYLPEAVETVARVEAEDSAKIPKDALTLAYEAALEKLGPGAGEEALAEETHRLLDAMLA